MYSSEQTITRYSINGKNWNIRDAFLRKVFDYISNNNQFWRFFSNLHFHVHRKKNGIFTKFILVIKSSTLDILYVILYMKILGWITNTRYLSISKFIATK